MKLNRIITLCAVAATLVFTVGSAFAQDNGNDNGGNQRRNRQGGPGGPGGGGFGRMDPQQMMDRVREVLNFTNDTDWSAVQPLVQKVMDARRDVGFGGGMRLLFRNRGGDNGGGRNFGPQPGPEEKALEDAIESDAPAAQIKDLLAKYKSAQKAKQDKLEAAQDALKAVLTPKQEAQALLLGLVR